MMAVDEDDLICDYAQYYGIRDYRQLEPQYAAVLAAGLPSDARIIKRIKGWKLDLNTTLFAKLVDLAAIDVWMKTKDGRKGRNRPKSILAALDGNTAEGTEKNAVFNTPEDFDAARRCILGDNNG